jgi:purine-nucleoside phosphorylase
MNTASAQHLDDSVKFIRKHSSIEPSVALILGSGLGEYADSFTSPEIISSADIPYFPRSSVAGHRGKLVFGGVSTKNVLAFQGRVHLYEGHSADSVVYPVRVAQRLGVKQIILTNAAGGIGRHLWPGALMLISDHINLLGKSYVELPQISSFSGKIYSSQLNEIAVASSAKIGLKIASGVYVGLRGPSYETASEVEMILKLGGDAVGMSTVLEASLGAHLGMEVMGISCVTNMGTGISGEKLNHSEVTEVAASVTKDFSGLLTEIISRI